MHYLVVTARDCKNAAGERPADAPNDIVKGVDDRVSPALVSILAPNDHSPVLGSTGNVATGQAQRRSPRHISNLRAERNSTL